MGGPPSGGYQERVVCSDTGIEAKETEFLCLKTLPQLVCACSYFTLIPFPRPNGKSLSPPAEDWALKMNCHLVLESPGAGGVCPKGPQQTSLVCDVTSSSNVSVALKAPDCLWPLLTSWRAAPGSSRKKLGDSQASKVVWPSDTLQLLGK